MKFLTLYFRAVDEYQSKNPENFLEDYRRFYLEWAGKDFDDDLMLRDMKNHKTVSLPEQQAAFDSATGRSEVQKKLETIARFFAGLGHLAKTEAMHTGTASYATDKFVKLVPPNLKVKK